MNLSLIKRLLRRIVPKVQKRIELQNLSERMLDLRDKGKMAEAYQIFQEFTAKAPQLSESGDFCVFQAEFELAANDDYQKALKFIEQAERLGCEKDSFYYRVHGDIMSGTGNLEQAITDYQRSRDLNPSMSTLVALAWAMLMAKDGRLAGICEEILKDDPDSARAHVCLGWYAIWSGDAVRSLSMAKKAARLAEWSRDVFEVARLFHTLRQYGTAISIYLEADRLGYQKKAASYAGIAACYLSVGRASEARKWSEQAVQLDPDDGYVQEVWRHACEKDIDNGGG